MSRGRFDLWPKTYHPDIEPWHCVICVAPCEAPGWVEIEGPNIRVCRCCIELLVETAPDIAHDSLAHRKSSNGEAT